MRITTLTYTSIAISLDTKARALRFNDELFKGKVDTNLKQVYVDLGHHF